MALECLEVSKNSVPYQGLGVGIDEKGFLLPPIRFQRPLVRYHHGRVRGEARDVDGLGIGSQRGIHFGFGHVLL